jgi:ferritin-like protein
MRATRRELVQRAFAGGLVASLVWTGGAAAQPETDGEVLEDVLGIESLVVFVYARVLGLGLLSPHGGSIVSQLLRHEHAHAQALAPLVVALGGAPTPSPADANAADGMLAALHVSGRLADLRTEHDCLQLLGSLEGAVLAAYYAAMSKLSLTPAVTTVAQIMACEAQHATLLSDLLHPGNVLDAVPSPFVQ